MGARAIKNGIPSPKEYASNNIPPLNAVEVFAARISTNPSTGPMHPDQVSPTAEPNKNDTSPLF